MVQVPLIVAREAGVNDMLDRDGSRTPVEFPCGLGLPQPLNAQVVQAATKWKRPALRQFGCGVGEGICTDMRAVRKDYFLDHDHSAYVDQWDWERVITPADRNLGFLKDVGEADLERPLRSGAAGPGDVPEAADGGYPPIPEELAFIHAEEILERYPDLPAQAARDPDPAGVPRPCSSSGWAMCSRTATRTRCEPPTTTTGSPRPSQKLGNPPWAQRRHPGVEPGDQASPRAHLDGNPGHQGDPGAAAGNGRANREPPELPYHQAILNDQIPLSIGGGIGQSRTYMYLLRKAHLGEVSVTMWPESTQGHLPREEHSRPRVGKGQACRVRGRTPGLIQALRAANRAGRQDPPRPYDGPHRFGGSPQDWGLPLWPRADRSGDRAGIHHGGGHIHRPSSQRARPVLKSGAPGVATQIGWLVGMVAMVAMVVSPLAGKAADRLGPRRVILAVFALGAASSSLIATSASYAWLVAATAVGGLATSAGNPGTNKLITEQFPAGRRGTVMGIKQSGVQAAVFLCGLALPPLAGAFGWRVAAGALVPIAAVGLLATFRCLPQDRSVRGRAPLALRDAGHRSAMIGHLAAYAFMMGAGAAALSSFLPLYSEEAVGLSPVAAGATSAVMGLTGIVARVVWGRATEHAPTFFLPLAWQGGLAGIAVLLIAAASKVPQLVWLGRSWPGPVLRCSAESEQGGGDATDDVYRGRRLRSSRCPAGGGSAAHGQRVLAIRRVPDLGLEPRRIVFRLLTDSHVGEERRLRAGHLW